MISGKFFRLISFEDIFAYKRPYAEQPETINGLKNFHFVFKAPLGSKLILLERGISNPAPIDAVDGKRVPFIAILTAPNKFKSVETPWADVLNIHDSTLIYFGDNKKPNQDPLNSTGNKALNDNYSSNYPTPLLIFEKISYNGKIKGFRKFLGYGNILSVKKIIQIHPMFNFEFENYEYEINLLNDHNEQFFNWEWITSRYDKKKSIIETEESAPQNWLEFLHGKN